MKIGIVAATRFEIQPTINFLQQHAGRHLSQEIELIITGIGSMSAAYSLTKYITVHSPDLLLQAGIAGSFSNRFPAGSTVIISEESLGDLGAAENNLFNDLFDLKLMEASLAPYSERQLKNPFLEKWSRFGLPFAGGVTVNEITTRTERISLLKEKYHCDIESMEGAAFHFVCLQENIPFLQLRSVSNFVGERDKKNWKLKESIENLNLELIKIIRQML